VIFEDLLAAILPVVAIIEGSSLRALGPTAKNWWRQQCLFGHGGSDTHSWFALLALGIMAFISHTLSKAPMVSRNESTPNMFSHAPSPTSMRRRRAVAECANPFLFTPCALTRQLAQNRGKTHLSALRKLFVREGGSRRSGAGTGSSKPVWVATVVQPCVVTARARFKPDRR